MAAWSPSARTSAIVRVDNGDHASGSSVWTLAFRQTRGGSGSSVPVPAARQPDQLREIPSSSTDPRQPPRPCDRTALGGKDSSRASRITVSPECSGFRFRQMPDRGRASVSAGQLPDRAVALRASRLADVASVNSHFAEMAAETPGVAGKAAGSENLESCRSAFMRYGGHGQRDRDAAGPRAPSRCWTSAAWQARSRTNAGCVSQDPLLARTLRHSTGRCGARPRSQRLRERRPRRSATDSSS